MILSVIFPKKHKSELCANQLAVRKFSRQMSITSDFVCDSDFQVAYLPVRIVS